MGIGFSGALLEVVKRGVDEKTRRRVGEQATWIVLRQSENPHVPRVTQVGDGWYRMEMLESRAPDFTDVPVIFKTLEKHFWSEKIRPGTADWEEDWEELRRERGWPDVPVMKEKLGADPCEVHGDPTVANLMWRGSVPVLIDPLPWRHTHLPPDRAVDLGKLLQSARGFEQGRADLTAMNYVTAMSGARWPLTLYFYEVHLHRMMPYVYGWRRTWAKRELDWVKEARRRV